MKKTILLIAAAFTAFTSFAGGNNIVGLTKKGEGVLSHGFYLNLGVAFPQANIVVKSFETTVGSVTVNNGTTTTYSQGVRPSLEIGNQWYFWHNDNVGVGLKVSWFQLGYGAYSLKDVNKSSTSQYGMFEARFLKLAPQFTYAINEDIAFDASFEFAPTVNIGGGVDRFDTGATTGYDITTIDTGFGFLFAPGIRARYKVFALGFDYGFGAINGAQVYSYSTQYSGAKVNSATYTNTQGVARIYLGFQF